MNSFETAIEKSRIRYHDVPGSGSPLLFIHGLGCASSFDYPRIASDAALLGRRMLLVDLLGLEQPSVSKHLRVLHDVDLVRVRREGRQMLYRTNADAIRPLYEWSGGFKQYWRNQLQRIKERAEDQNRN